MDELNKPIKNESESRSSVKIDYEVGFSDHADMYATAKAVKKDFESRGVCLELVDYELNPTGSLIFKKKPN